MLCQFMTLHSSHQTAAILGNRLIITQIYIVCIVALSNTSMFPGLELSVWCICCHRSCRHHGCCRLTRANIDYLFPTFAHDSQWRVVFFVNFLCVCDCVQIIHNAWRDSRSVSYIFNWFGFRNNEGWVGDER